MLQSLRTVKASIALLVLAIASSGLGFALPGAWGYALSALLAALAGYAAWGSENKTVKYLVGGLALVIFFALLGTIVFVLGLSVEGFGS